MKTAIFERFDFRLSRPDALLCSIPGQSADEAVAATLALPYVAYQFFNIAPESIREELAEYGAWDEEELADDAANRARIVWLAAGMIRDEG